jgi:hypothetical protein
VKTHNGRKAYINKNKINSGRSLVGNVGGHRGGSNGHGNKLKETGKMKGKEDVSLCIHYK